MSHRSIFPVKVDPFLLVSMGRAWDALRHKPEDFQVFKLVAGGFCPINRGSE